MDRALIPNCGPHRCTVRAGVTCLDQGRPKTQPGTLLGLICTPVCVGVGVCVCVCVCVCTVAGVNTTGARRSGAEMKLGNSRGVGQQEQEGCLGGDIQFRAVSVGLKVVCSVSVARGVVWGCRD